jgi:hypothetical protein
VSIQLAPGQTFVGAAPGGPGRGGRGGPPPGMGAAPGAPATTPAPTGPRRETEIGWLKPGETRTVTWTVRGSGQVSVTVGSTRGGVDTRSLTVR